MFALDILHLGETQTGRDPVYLLADLELPGPVTVSPVCNQYLLIAVPCLLKMAVGLFLAAGALFAHRAGELNDAELVQ